MKTASSFLTGDWKRGHDTILLILRLVFGLVLFHLFAYRALTLTGPGKFSLDDRLFHRK